MSEMKPFSKRFKKNIYLNYSKSYLYYFHYYYYYYYYLLLLLLSTTPITKTATATQKQTCRLSFLLCTKSSGFAWRSGTRCAVIQSCIVRAMSRCFCYQCFWYLGFGRFLVRSPGDARTKHMESVNM